jgi:hypothetical protein
MEDMRTVSTRWSPSTRTAPRTGGSGGGRRSCWDDVCPLNEAHLRQIAVASTTARRVLSAVRLASANIWLLAIASGVSLALGALDPSSAVLGIAIGLLAANEWRGRRALRRLSPSGATILGVNQLALLGVIVAFSAWGLWSTVHAPNPYATHMDSVPESARMLERLGDLQQTLQASLCLAMIGVSAIWQGATAMYYFTRAKHVWNYLSHTPKWIVELQRHIGLI